MNKTDIGYLTYTWNPTKGCDHISTGCLNCWAKRMSKRLAGMGVNGYDPTDSFKVTTYPDRLSEPLKMKKPQTIGVSFMGDLFHDDVPDWFIKQVFNIMLLAKWHEFVVLTKRPERAAQVIGDMFKDMTWRREDFEHVRFGVSVEDQSSAVERLTALSGVPLNQKWISLEPMVGPVDFSKVNYMNEIKQITLGGESNGRPMHPDWARAVRDWCAEHDVPFWFKQWGDWVDELNDVLDGMNISKYPESDKFVERGYGPHGQGYKGLYCYRIGKKAAGHLLDGVEHQEWFR